MAEEYLSESPVELALRFADLAGSSQMTKVLAAEVRRIRGIVIKEAQNQEAIAEGIRAGQCACNWYDTGGIHATNCTKVPSTVEHLLAARSELHRTREELINVRNETRRLRAEYGGLSARLAASRTEREKLQGDKVRMLAAIDGALASLRPWGETRSGRFPLANATVIAVHEFTESSEVPNACALCGWPERSQVHRTKQREPHKYVSATEEYPGSGPGQCATCGSGEWDSIHDQHRVVTTGVTGPDGELVTVKAIGARTMCECGHPNLNHEFNAGTCSQCPCTGFVASGAPALVPLTDAEVEEIERERQERIDKAELKHDPDAAVLLERDADEQAQVDNEDAGDEGYPS